MGCALDGKTEDFGCTFFFGNACDDLLVGEAEELGNLIDIDSDGGAIITALRNVELAVVGEHQIGIDGVAHHFGDGVLTAHFGQFVGGQHMIDREVLIVAATGHHRQCHDAGQKCSG